MNLIPGIPALLANGCGFAGMGLCVAAYAYTTAARPGGPNPYVQHGANLAGALLLIVSLLAETNPASLVMETIWSAIALSGLVQAARKDPT